MDAGMGKSQYLAGLDAEQRARLEQKLLARQSGRCFICDQPIDLVLHKGQLRESGTHQQLLAQRRIYFKLFELQYRSDRLTGTEASTTESRASISS